MGVSDRTAKWLWVAAAALLVGGAAVVQTALQRLTGAEEDVALTRALARRHPEYVLLTTAPGGLRAPFVGALWIRAEALKEDGQFHEAKQLADMICSLQPRFAGAWAFNAWNMAYNISVATHTKEERWHWVSNGLRLLRDRGIQANPDSLNLYRELAWMFFHKLGGYTDEMHYYYKRRWAAEMQRLLAPPAYGSTEEILAAFRPIAEAPLDRGLVKPALPLPAHAVVAAMVLAVAGLVVLALPRCHNAVGLVAAGVLILAGAGVFGGSLILHARRGPPAAAAAALPARQRLLNDPNAPRVGEYVRRLAACGLELDWPLLDAYNRFSHDEALRAVRVLPPRPKTPRERRIAAVINDPAFADARRRVLAFVRAKILWRDYKMDPRWMLDLMAQYGPLDWRLVYPHSLYWSSYGLHVCEGTPLHSFAVTDMLNTARIVLNSIKDLTWSGRLTYVEDPNNPDEPQISMLPDPRFVPAALEVFDQMRRQAGRQRQTANPTGNVLGPGHVNYLINLMNMYWAMHERPSARRLFEYVKDTYDKHGGIWDLPLEEFLIANLREVGPPSFRYAMSRIVAAVRAAYVLRVHGRPKAHRENMQYAMILWRSTKERIAERYELEPMEILQARVVAELLIRPRAVGYVLSLDERALLYNDFYVTDAMRRAVYDLLVQKVRPLCRREGIAFDTAFPEPPGMAAYRAAQRRRGLGAPRP
jgi:hypothetical protein